MVGTSNNSARRLERASPTQRRVQIRPPSYNLAMTSRVRDEATSYGSDRSYRDKDDAPEEPLFKSISKAPQVSDGPLVWRKHYALAEGQLRQWNKLKDTPDASEKTLEKWDRILPYIDSLQISAAQLFLCDTKYYVQSELDVRVWKYGIYQFIGLLRGLPTDIKDKNLIKLAFKDVFDKGLGHIKYLLIHATEVLKIELGYVFNRTKLLRGSTRKDELTAEENLVYRLFIAMGDLHRYRFDLDRNARDAKLASDMYNAARFCDTEKSRAYYQLALMNKVKNDIVGTIYNFTRAYSASVPADGAREQLLYIYDDLYKKFNSHRSDFWYSQCQLTEQYLTRGGRQSRDEIWLFYDNSSKPYNLPVVPVIPPTKSEHLAQLPFEDILRRFSLAFGHFLGILYTKIGTEALEVVGKEVIVYFDGLARNHAHVKFGFVMEVLGMLLYITDYLTPPPNDKSNTIAGTLAQIHHMRSSAIEVTLNMIMILSEKILDLVRNLDWENSSLAMFTAILHTWCRWSKRRSYLCSDLYSHWKILSKSPQKLKGEDKQYITNFLVTFLRLHTEITLLLQRYSTALFPKLKSECVSPVYTTSLGSLPEQFELDNFEGVLLAEDFNTETFYYDGRFTKVLQVLSHKHMAQVHFRFARILRFSTKFFGDSKRSQSIASNKALDLSSIPTNDLVEKEFDILRLIHLSLMESPHSSTTLAQEKDKCSKADSNNARVIIKKISEQPEENEWGFVRLKYTKASMSKMHELWSNLCLRGIKTQLIIKPLRVVLDTNCLIRQLHWIDQLKNILPHPLIVPSTVLLELRGLMKGAKTGKSPKTSQKLLTSEEKQTKFLEIIELGKMCISALEYLNDKKKYFRIFTICGREIKMYNYLKQRVYDEEMGPGVRNDEKILELCAHLEAMDEKGRQEDTPLCLHRGTVLLTGDRALRVRAFAQETPARDIESFTDWALRSYSKEKQKVKLAA